MYVLVEERNNEEPDSPRWHATAAAAAGHLLSVRQKEMMGFGKKEIKWVVTCRGHSFLGFLSVVCQYATVDDLCLLPPMILFNVFSLLMTLQELGLL